LSIYLVFVGGVERNLTDFVVLLPVFNDISHGQLDTFQESRFRRITVAFPENEMEETRH
jgi:hypothetical protein